MNVLGLGSRQPHTLLTTVLTLGGWVAWSTPKRPINHPVMQMVMILMVLMMKMVY
jgi:hypothetical protein